MNKFLLILLGLAIFCSCKKQIFIDSESKRVKLSCEVESGDVVISLAESMDSPQKVLCDSIWISSGEQSCWIKMNSGGKFVNDTYEQSLFCKYGELKIFYEAGVRNSILATLAFIPNQPLENVSIGVRFFDIPPMKILQKYCLPLSLPYLRADSLNVIPAGFIANKETFNNTFSLITDNETYSVSVLPPSYRLNNKRDSVASSNEYLVGFTPDRKGTLEINPIEGSITLVCNHNYYISKGDKVIRQFLISADRNDNAIFATGLHIGEYMATVDYFHKENLTDVYRKSMSHLLNNSYCFKAIDGQKENYFGASYSQTGEPYGNGNAIYAMYGNSFSTVALNQYKKISNNKEIDRRLSGINWFLTKSDVLTPQGAYWSMLDLLQGKGYVDQAYRKWVETHATAWVTYYLLNAYEISSNSDYLNTAIKTLKWLASVQRKDGSFPKYFENGLPSDEAMGDIAWVALSFFKADELKVKVDNVDLKKCAEQALNWMVDNVVNTKQYYGSFEDVGGVNDAYCSSVSARAFIEGYKSTNNKIYLDIAEKIMSVSLSWITCDYTEDEMFSWNQELRIQPAYAHVESTSCYFPCSYTLPLLYKTAAELALLVDGSVKKNYWLSVSKNFNHISDFLSDNAETKMRYGMEWLLGPFLVFNEWGNSQLCWNIIDTFRYRILNQLPDFLLTPQLSANYKGDTYQLYMPEWNEYGRLLKTQSGVEAIFFRDQKGELSLMLLSENKHVSSNFEFEGILKDFTTDEIILKNNISGETIGQYTKDQLKKGVNLNFSDFLFVKLKSVK